MDHFKLNLVPAAKPSDATKLRRKFQSAKISLLDVQVLNILKMHNLRSLELSERIVDKKMLVKSLMHFKLLERFTADKVSFDKISAGAFVDPVQIKHLKWLSIVHSDISILQLISAEMLEDLTVQTNKVIGKELMDFLDKRPMLNRLKLLGSFLGDFFSEKSIAKLPFRLKYLNVSQFNLDKVDNKLTDFIDVHKNSLEELSIKCSLRDSEKLFIVQNLSNLKTLQFPIEFTSECALQSLTPQKNLSRFNPLAGRNNSVTSNWHRIFPSVEFLNVDSFSPKPQLLKHFLSMSTLNSEKLRGLHVESINPQSLHCVKHLKELHVLRIDNEVDFNTFISYHSGTLEKLSIGQIDEDSFSRGVMINSIKACKQLRHLSITTNSPFVTRKLAKIKFHHSWTLESSFKTKRGHETELVKVVFKLPDDNALLEERCRIWDDDLIREFSRIDGNYGLNVFVNMFK